MAEGWLVTEPSPLVAMQGFEILTQRRETKGAVSMVVEASPG
jgi:hypothetical protein